jgi:hypothetical protein
MPLNEIPRHFNPETRNLIEAALEDAWQELNKDGDHHIGHRPIRELPRSQRFTQEKQQVLVTRVVVKGLVEALDVGARTFEHLGKIGIAEEKRSGDLGGLVVTA